MKSSKATSRSVFDGYSYLEDLEFSYRVGKEYDLYVVAGADFAIIRAKEAGSASSTSVRLKCNRLYFVRKHGLSVRCYAGLGTRLLMTLARQLDNATKPLSSVHAGMSRVCCDPGKRFRDHRRIVSMIVPWEANETGGLA